MIVRSLRAEGFMRYRRIELTDLPEGVIGLVGDNEAGKTTLGEAVAFALFGRTIRTEDTDPTQAINWDVDVCQTSITVETREHGRMRVERLVARTGEFEAKLYDASDELIAEGGRAVNEELVKRIGFDFPTFRYSFYVAQGELDLVQREGRDNAKRIVYDMLGISTIERARDVLEDEARELRERSSTLERDLIVASALHTDALPLKEELLRFEGLHEAAKTGLAEAEDNVRHATDEAQRCETASSAHRERHSALSALERALVADTQRRNLLRSRQRLQSLLEGAQTHARKAESGLTLDANARKKAIDDLARAQKTERQAQRLKTLVEHRAKQLSDAVSDIDSHGLPARKTREEAVVAREKRTALYGTLGFLLFFLIGVAGVVGVVGMHVPADAPFLGTRLPADGLHSPRLGVSFAVTTNRMTGVLGTIGGVGLLLAFIALFVRIKAVTRRVDAETEVTRLDDLLGADRGELEACERYKLPKLTELERSLSVISDPQVRMARDELIKTAGEFMQRDETPAQILTKAKERNDELEAAHREAEPRLREARRVGNAAEAAMQKVEVALELAYADGAPEIATGQGESIPDTLEEISSEIEAAAAEATRARVELEAALAGGSERAVAECVRELRDALSLGFAAMGEDAGSLRVRYDEQTGLPELLKDRAVLPSSESLRAVTRRERELLDELLGDEETVRAALRAADEDLRQARQARSLAQAALDDAVARGERAEQGRRKLTDLETKIKGLRGVLEPSARKVKVQEEAIDILGDLIEVMKARFGPGIARYVEIVLPHLTNDRYARVKIDPDLDIRVYSTERGGYVRLIELSLGTADQLLVALRLGLARGLAHSRGLPGGHFLFLDEPLVSADKGREQSFLNLLRTFDDEFAQIFVSSPRELPSDGPFTGLLRVSREDSVLRYEGANPA